MTRHVGPAAVAGYVIMTAAQGVALSSLVQRNVWDALSLMVATFIVVAGLFNLLQLRGRGAYAKLLRISAAEVLWINVLSAVNFISYYWAIRTVPISSHAVIAIGVGPLAVLLVEWRTAVRPGKAEAIAIAGLAGSLVLVAGALIGRVALFDLAMSFVCGISLVLTLYSVRRLSAQGWSASQVMAARFFLLIAAGLMLTPGFVLPTLSLEQATMQVALLAGLGIVIPVYLLTFGQCHTAPLNSTMLLYSMPILMVIGELIEGRIEVSPLIIAGLLATCVFLAIGYLSKRRTPPMSTDQKATKDQKVTKDREMTDCALVVGGYSSGALYAREFAKCGLTPVHVAPAPVPPTGYGTIPLAPEFAVDLPFESSVDATLARLREPSLRHLRPVCVVAGNDHGVGRADLLAERLSLPSNSSKLSAVRRNKFLTIERLRAHGLNAAFQLCTRDLNAVADAVRQHPEIRMWVVKPTESAGSDRVALCRTSDEVLEAARRILDGTNVFGERDEEVLVQEYLTCAKDDNEYVVNTCSMVDPGTGRVKHRIVSIYRYEKIKMNGAPFIYYARHLLPYHGPVQRKLARYFVACLDALEIRQGPCHGELRMTERGPALVEANVGRPDGGGIPKLDLICTGHDQVSLNVDSLIDPEQFGSSFAQPYRLLKHGRVAFFVSHRHGTLRAMPGLARLRALPSFVDAVFIAEAGKRVCPTVDVTSLLGWAFLANADERALDADYSAVRELEAHELFDIVPDKDDPIEPHSYSVEGALAPTG